MRMTFSQIQGSLDAINVAAAQFARAQQQVGTGKRLQRPSDDPLAAGRAIQHSTQLANIDSYARSADAASTRLSVLDSALSNMGDILTDALATATSGAGSQASQTARDTAGTKLTALRDDLAKALNATSSGVYVFSGSKTQTPPYANTTGSWVYSGDTAAVTVDTGKARAVAVTVDGQKVAKGSDAQDVFTVLDSLAADVQSGNTAGVTTGIAALNRAFGRVVKAQSVVGTDEASVVDGQTQLTKLRLSATQQLSNDQEINMADAISQMSRAQTAYQAALGAVSAASKQSLLDYLR
jgi:flagellar hook-associated protein 3 FlgL